MVQAAAEKLAFVLGLPFVVAIAFLLIADIDAPRRGLIQVRPQNLEALPKSFAKSRKGKNDLTAECDFGGSRV